MQHAIREELTPHQRQIVVAIALNGVPDRRPELDRYVELELAGGDADAAVPGLRAHLAGCPACAEEHDSLRALVAAERRD